MKMEGCTIDHDPIEYPCEYEIVFEGGTPSDGFDQWLNFLKSPDGERIHHRTPITMGSVYSSSLLIHALSTGGDNIADEISHINEISIIHIPLKYVWRSKASNVPYLCALNALSGDEKIPGRCIIDFDYN